MPGRPLFLIVILAALLAWQAMPVGAQPLHSATDKIPKPDDPLYSPSRAAFDCTGRLTLDLFPGFTEAIQDSTTASDNNLTGYPCRPWSEQGPENIYRLEVAQSLELFAALRHYDDQSALPDEDFDIFLFNDCDTDSCLVGANQEFSSQLGPGTYYLIVDGCCSANPAEGFYTLLLECRELGVPLQICEPGGATTVSPGTEIITIDSNLFDQPNLVQNYDCSPIVERGGELWFAISLDAFHEFTATTLSLAGTLDAALWIFDGCGPEAQCLDFVDDKLAGQAETLVLANDTDAAITVLLALDCYRAPLSETLGEVTIQFAGVSNVPTVKRSLGSVRSLYR